MPVHVSAAPVSTAKSKVGYCIFHSPSGDCFDSTHCHYIETLFDVMTLRNCKVPPPVLVQPKLKVHAPQVN